jgi:multidrug efflux system membrane fusion protein
LAPLAGCSAKQEKPKEKPPAPVTVEKVRQMSVPVEIRAIGNVEPYATVAVKSMVAGTVTGVHFREGQDVAKGALLFTIDPRPFAAALSQAQANLARDLAMAANAGAQARRYAGLVKEGIVTREQYDQLKTNADSLSASVASDRAAIESAKLQLGFCYIHAPMSGRTGNLAVNAGNLVKANETPALVTMNQTSPLFVSFSLPEKDLGAIKAKMGGRLPVEASVPNSGLAAEKGVVTFLDNGVDQATGTIWSPSTGWTRRRSACST